MDNNLDSHILQICRTCMIQITSVSPVSYLDYTPRHTHLTIRQKLNNCIPELDLSIVSNAVICSKCADTIKYFYKFKKQCLQSDIQIKKYMQQVLEHTGEENFVEVVQSHQPHNRNHDTKVKMEDFDIKEEFNEDFVCETDAFNETGECTELVEPENLLSLENVDTQYVFFNTNENYNLSATEEYSDTPNSDITQNCSPEVTEHQENCGSNLNRMDVGFQCYRCGYKTESKLKLILHFKRHTQKHFHHKEINSNRLLKNGRNLFYYRCSLCNYLTKYKCLFGFHNRIHLTKREYKHIWKRSDVQRKSFTNNKIDKKNNNRVLKFNSTAHIVTKPFKWSVCTYQSNLKKYLKQHIQVHSGEKPFPCSVCEYQTNQKSNLKQHMRIHTGEKPFSCSFCVYQSSQKCSLLKTHMRIHTGEKPFSCSVCEYQCSQKCNLKKHMQIHTGEKPFSCSICVYQCNLKDSLKKHLRIHTGEKPFSCPVCQYQCSQKQHLKQHMQIHTGEKPFSCSICEYQCKHKSSLKRHMRIHTGEMPFSCYVCEYKCSQKGNLQRHMKIHTEKIETF